ncbi:MAG: BlaI/MecI/CopY family transcriptional regulator [Lachnospiraceae bacterium]|jgi:predicted transcriptional regulator|nr:BlaI/MecI/CopY family transcriptional regulator [Lachnospiraceae bacterium]
MKLFDSEIKVMDVLWRYGDFSAGKIARILKEEIGWNRNTTYTVIKKCINKGAIKRYEPNFMCRAMISREEIQRYEATELVERLFGGSVEKLFATFISNDYLSKEEITILREYMKTL